MRHPAARQQRKGTHRCMSITTFNSFILQTEACGSTIQKKGVTVFHDNNGCAKATQWYVTRTLPTLFNVTEGVNYSNQ